MNRNKRKTKQGNKRRTSGKSLGIIRVMPVNTRRKIPATLTEEQEWQTDVPNIKLSRAFLIFLMLHIVAVAGILLFNMMKGEELEAAAATTSDSKAGGKDGSEPTTNGVSRSAPLGGTSPWLDDSNATTVPMDRAEYRGLRQHVVRSGDSLKSIAAQHLVSPRELAALNKLTENDLLRIGQLIVIPSRKLNPSLPDELRDMQSRSDDELADVPLPGTIGIPGDIDIPDEIPAPAPRRAPLVDVTPSADPVTPPAAIPARENDTVISSVPERPVVVPGATQRQTPKPDKVVNNPPRAKPVQTVVPKATPKPAPAANDPPAAGRIYTMKRGDTAYGVARKHGINYRDLLKANGISDKGARSLPVGKVLKIPAK